MAWNYEWLSLKQLNTLYVALFYVRTILISASFIKFTWMNWGEVRLSGLKGWLVSHLAHNFDIKCPTFRPWILILSHYSCPTFTVLSVLFLGAAPKWRPRPHRGVGSKADYSTDKLRDWDSTGGGSVVYGRRYIMMSSCWTQENNAMDK